jgi:hypothetical protein
MRPIRKLVGLGIVASSILGLSTGATAAYGNAAEGADYYPIDVIASGRVTQNDLPVSVAQVQVRVWPNLQFLENVPEGESFDLPVIYDGVTASTDGTWEAEVDPAFITNDYREPDGTVNILVAVTDGLEQAAWNLSVARGVDGTWNTALAGGTDLVRPILNFNFGSTPTVSDHNGTHEVATDSKSGIFQPTQYGCGNTVAGDWHYGRGEFFARVFGTADAPATITQTYGNDHELGIGFDPSGTATWRMSGTSKISLSASAERGGLAGSVAAWNKINYRDFVTACIGEYRRPISAYGLLTGFTATGTPRWTACNPYYSGQASKVQGRNTTWSTGVDIGPIKVSAQGGWNSEVKTTWTFRAPEYICGSTSQGWVSSPEAQARPTSAP